MRRKTSIKGCVIKVIAEGNKVRFLGDLLGIVTACLLELSTIYLLITPHLQWAQWASSASGIV